MKVFNVSDSDSFISQTTSKGDQRKIRIGNYFVKEDTMGYEGLAEVLASELESRVVNIDFSYVDYSFCKIVKGGVGKVGCYSENFLKEGQKFISALNIFRQGLSNEEYEKVRRLRGKNLLEAFLNVSNNVTGLDVGYIKNCLSLMIRIDYIILNEDRHYNNFGFIEENGKYRFSPIFDNGLSLLSDLGEYQIQTQVLHTARKVKAKTFNSDFKKQVDYFGACEKLKIKDFEFFEKLKKEDYDKPYSDSIFFRAKRILISRLLDSRGFVWEDC